MATVFVGKIYKHFVNLTDTRVNRGRNYPLMELIFVALCAAICDCNAWTDVADFGRDKLTWFQKFLPFRNGIASHDTFSEVFARLETIEFYAALESWAQELAVSLRGETVAFDGKTLRGSHDASAGQSALHSVSAWACGLRLCLALKSVDDKSNEIPAVQALIDLLELEGAIVTADAMHCQTATAEKIIAQGADYLLMVKGNQAALQQELEDALYAAFEEDCPEMRTHQRSETNRGRGETRAVSILPVPNNLPVFERWPGLQTIGCIYRSREIDGVVQESQEYFISSLPCKVRALAKHLRAHWSTENSQHHILDVTFREDASRIRKGNGPEISSVFRRLALNILQRDTSLKGSLRSKRKRCGWCERTFEQLLAGFAEN
jgi:predicted transposase YbfD/YdcC